MHSYYFLEILILVFKAVASVFVNRLYSKWPCTTLVISPDGALAHLPSCGLGQDPMTVGTISQIYGTVRWEGTCSPTFCSTRSQLWSLTRICPVFWKDLSLCLLWILTKSTRCRTVIFISDGNSSLQKFKKNLFLVNFSQFCYNFLYIHLCRNVHHL